MLYVLLDAQMRSRGEDARGEVCRRCASGVYIELLPCHNGAYQWLARRSLRCLQTLKLDKRVS
jgi:hypothetical protein